CGKVGEFFDQVLHADHGSRLRDGRIHTKRFSLVLSTDDSGRANRIQGLLLELGSAARKSPQTGSSNGTQVSKPAAVTVARCNTTWGGGQNSCPTASPRGNLSRPLLAWPLAAQR